MCTGCPMRKQSGTIANAFLQLVSFEREAQECNNAEVLGLAYFIKKYVCVAALYMFSAVIPIPPPPPPPR